MDLSFLKEFLLKEFSDQKLFWLDSFNIPELSNITLALKIFFWKLMIIQKKTNRRLNLLNFFVN